MNAYRNPWYSPSGTDPEMYRTDATPVRVGKYLRFHRIKSRNPSGNCYDYVLDGICVTQRCGAGMTEAQIDEYLAEQEAA